MSKCQQATGAQPEAGELFTKAGTYLCGRSRYAEAQALLGRAVALGEQVYGTDHPALLSRLEQQAKLCGELEQFESAEALLRRVLALGEHHLGPEHLQIARTLTDLALLHQAQGRYTEAEQMCQRALSMLQTLQEKPESDGTAL
ncbi:MAG TPA: tetratricopeptide repeat protein, partial [Ktedonobacteraceae bacterium]